MIKIITRRKFLKTTGICTIGSLSFPFPALAESKREKLYNDSENVLLARMLFGEGRSVSNAEKIVIGFTPLNRAGDDKKFNGRTLKEALLKPEQYSCFNDNPKDKKGYENFLRVLNPYLYEPNKWIKCLKISKNLLKGEYDKYNYGPTHYHKKGEKPKWIKGMKEKLDSTGFKHQFYREA